MADTVQIMVGTRKGAFFFQSKPSGRGPYVAEAIQFLGSEVSHLVQDPRDPARILLALKSGHLGPTVQRSVDYGRTWEEATTPPQFPKVDDVDEKQQKTVKSVFWLEPGHASKAGEWWAGTVPHALFHTADHGQTWVEVSGLRNYLSSLPDAGDFIGETPSGAITHSVRLDPRDAKHLYVSVSTGGTFDSPDGGASWKPLNGGVAADFLPDGDHQYGHDPHCLVVHPKNPDRLYQQNHCGIYRLDRPGDTWERIGKAMPAEIGDIGFPIVTDPLDPDTVWVFPMDGTAVWPRTSPAGRPAVYRTTDAGQSWMRLDQGLPRENAHWTVLRQAMTADWQNPVGLYFGTTCGEVWVSPEGGKSWERIAEHLPYIQSLTVAKVAQ